MGWWPFRRGPLEAKKLPKDKLAVLDGPELQAASAEGFPPAITRPTSIFEFGPPVAGGGEFLRGMCAGDNPDAIQACTWSVEQVQVKAKARKFLVEF
jgi:hypothetical protein